MRENNIQDILKRVKRAFSDRFYKKSLSETDKKWIDDPIDKVLETLLSFLESLE